MNIEIANRLLQYRKKNSLSQEELAEKIGVSRQAVSKWERAEASPDTDNLIRLAEIYGVTVDELLTGRNADKNEDLENSSENNVKAEDGSDNPKTDDTYNNDNIDGAENQDCDFGSEQTEPGGDRVSFTNEIHVDAKNGDSVHIGFDGVHVNAADGTRVNVDQNGVFVEENGRQRVYTAPNGHIFYDDEIKQHMDGKHKKSIWYKFPYPIAALIVFLVWGFSGVLGGFACSWLFLLTIPIYYTLVDAIIKRKPHHFCYPVLAVIIFFVWGFWWPALGGFALAWIIFLTIPIYYFVCKAIED